MFTAYFPYASISEMQATQEEIRKCNVSRMRGFGLLHFDPSGLSVHDINKQFFFITGGYYVGKSTVMAMICQDERIHQVPEVKTRFRRKSDGPEVICVSETEFSEMQKRGDLVISYHANVGARSHRVGLRKKDFQNLLPGHRYGIVMHPNAIMTFLTGFWIRTFLLFATPKDRKEFQGYRGVRGNDAYCQDLSGSFSPENVHLPFQITWALRNYAGCPELVAGVIRTILDQTNCSVCHPDRS